MRVHLIPVCLLLTGLSAPAFPEDPTDPLVEDEETLSEDFLEDLDPAPLDLNSASVEDLLSLPGVSRADAERIVAFRAARGPFRRPRDLALIAGLPLPLVEALLPRVTVNKGASSRSLTSRARFVRRSASAAAGSFLTGSALHTRAIYRAGDRVVASVTTDKDAGEGSPLDFAAGYAEVRPTANSRLVLGDFRPGFAQGLALSRWSRAPVDLGQAVRQPSRQVGYRSTGENGAFRGLYLDGTVGAWRVCALGSSARLDAARDASGLVERLEESGLHVTALERSRADALRENALGLRVERAQAGRLMLGATALRSSFDPPFTSKEGGLSGGAASVAALDGGVSLGSLTVAGEAARTGRGARAWVAGVSFRGRRVRAGLQARDYGTRFQTLRGAGFSTFGESRNERGLFAGLTWKGRRVRAASLTLDRAWHPAPTATLPAGSARSSLTLRVEHRPLPGTLVQGSGRARWDETSKGKEKGVLPRRRQTLRLDVVQRLGRVASFHGRGEMARTGMGRAGEAGGAVFGGLEVRWKGVRLDHRLTYFDIPSYDSRLYEWESAPEGMMAFRTLTGRGVKGYARISVKAGPVRATCRLWRQWPLDGRRVTTEVVAQVEVNRK